MNPLIKYPVQEISAQYGTVPRVEEFIYLGEILILNIKL